MSAPAIQQQPREPMTHELKMWPAPFDAVASGRKRYEIRKQDRDYRVGDFLLLRRWDPDLKAYTGSFWTFRITYMTSGGEWGLPEGLCVLGIGPLGDDGRWP